MFGLVCATGEERKAALRLLDEWRPVDLPLDAFLSEGEFGGSRAALVCAGAGKAQAAAATQFLIDRYSPEVILNFGTAGALAVNLRVGDVVVATSLLHGDIGVVHGEGFGRTGASVMTENGLVCVREYVPDTSFLESAREDLAGLSLPGGGTVRFEPVVTCDQVVLSREFRDDLRRASGAAVVEMEGASVAQVAVMNHLPFVVIRGVSDTLDFDLVGLEELFRYMGESRASCFSRRARFAAMNPAAMGKVGKLTRGIRKASDNAARVALRLVSNWCQP